MIVAFKDRTARRRIFGVIEVAMPLGLYTRCEVSAPCGLCSKDGVIGLLDVPDTFLDPDRMRAGLLWFTRGFVEYQFPNNAKLANAEVGALELAMELSSEVPGTSKDWPSDITVAINGHEIDTWTSPGDYRRQARQAYARLVEARRIAVWRPEALARHDRTAPIATASRFPDARSADLDLERHRSIRMRIGVKEDARIPAASTSSAAASAITSKDIVLRLLEGLRTHSVA